MLELKQMKLNVQYNLDRQAAKISAPSSGQLEKYEYLTSKVLGLKPGPIEKKQVEDSPLAQIITKGLKKYVKAKQ